MDEMQAAILRLKLAHIGRWTEARQAIAARYDEAFEGTRVRTQELLAHSTSAYHLYTIRIEGRDQVRDALKAAEIGCGVYYPQPLHRQSCFAAQDGRIQSSAAGSGDTPQAHCPNADALSASVLSLPCFPGLRAAEQERIIEVVLGALEG